jgi:hypothetical protein
MNMSPFVWSSRLQVSAEMVSVPSLCVTPVPGLAFAVPATIVTPSIAAKAQTTAAHANFHIGPHPFLAGTMNV